MLIFALLLPAVFAIYEASEYVERMESFEALRAETQNPDFLIISIVFEETGALAKEFQDIYLDVIKDYKGFFRTLAYDCTDNWDICTETVRKSLPAIQAYKPKGMSPFSGKPDVDVANFSGEAGWDSIGKFIASNMPYWGTKITSRNIDDFQSKEGSKILLFTNKKKPSPLVKALTAYYKDRLEFGLVYKDEDQILDTFDPKKMPTFIALTEDGNVTYTGEVDFENLVKFCDQYALTEKRE